GRGSDDRRPLYPPCARRGCAGCRQGHGTRGRLHRGSAFKPTFGRAFGRKMSMEADFVIIGSGSAGSAMAYRLSEDGRYSVIVIEYGVPDVGPLIQMPAALSFPMNM